MILVQEFVGSMCESIDVMKITPKQREFVKAAMRAAIDYANAKHGMHASQGARDALSISSQHGVGK